MSSLDNVSSGDRINRVFETEGGSMRVEWAVEQVKFTGSPGSRYEPDPRQERGVGLRRVEDGLEQFVPERVFEEWTIEPA